MSADPLDCAFRAAAGRITAALAARYRDLDLAEEAFAEACARAAVAWRAPTAPPEDPTAWLYRAADRVALDRLRRRHTAARLPPDPAPSPPNAEEALLDDARLIPDERLRLIFICCHPAVAPDSRAALTLRLVCGLTTAEIARAFLVTEPALAQRLLRAKRKIAEAGVPFELPPPAVWPGRLDAVLSTLEVAYAKAHEDAAGTGPHAGYAAEMLHLAGLPAELLPQEPEALALAALVRFAEARRPARTDPDGLMIPLSEQDPALWRRPLVEAGDGFLDRAAALGPLRPRVVQAAIHGVWCQRRSIDEAPPWPTVLRLYNTLLTLRDDVIVRLKRAVALAEVAGTAAGLAAVEALDAQALAGLPAFHAVRADLLRRIGQVDAARAAYDAALILDPGPAEARWLKRRRDELGTL